MVYPFSNMLAKLGIPTFLRRMGYGLVLMLASITSDQVEVLDFNTKIIEQARPP
jgi:hypothetical protein